MKRTLIVAILALCCIHPSMAQIEKERDNAFSDFQKFRDSIFNDFENFRRQANEEYARFMQEPWKEVETKPEMKLPEKPKPPKPVVAVPTERPKAEPIPFDGAMVKPKPIEKPRPEPMEPIKMTPRPNEPVNTFKFFDTPMAFHFSKSHQLKLEDVSEKSVAALWTQLSDAYYDNLIVECLNHRNRYNLCDWAYLLLTKEVAEACCGGPTNESVVMHMYLLTQSGYQVRLGRSYKKLTVLFGSDEHIYRYKFLNEDGLYFYILDRSITQPPFYVYDHAFPKEKSLSLAISLPDLNVVNSEEHTFVSKKYPDVKVTVSTNQNLIDFCNTFPPSGEWNNYARASLSDNLKENLLPVLQEAIKGKSEWDAANILINFVQTGFEYKVDEDQFGYERPLFPDEIFYYPYSDCEDRSILFACLVRELMGLDVVFLDYPEHLATAVRFNEPVIGDYLEIDGQKYVVCDPTYINALVGMCMPQFKNVKPKVQRI